MVCDSMTKQRNVEGNLGFKKYESELWSKSKCTCYEKGIMTLWQIFKGSPLYLIQGCYNQQLNISNDSWCTS